LLLKANLVGANDGMVWDYSREAFDHAEFNHRYACAGNETAEPDKAAFSAYWNLNSHSLSDGKV